MDEKTTAALREVFEAWARERGSVIRRHVGIYSDFNTQARWEGFLACYQHLVPDGYVVVPKEPTPEMLAIDFEMFTVGNGMAYGPNKRNLYRAMIDAALDLQKEKQQC